MTKHLPLVEVNIFQIAQIYLTKYIIELSKGKVAGL